MPGGHRRESKKVDGTEEEHKKLSMVGLKDGGGEWFWLGRVRGERTRSGKTSP